LRELRKFSTTCYYEKELTQRLQRRIYSNKKTTYSTQNNNGMTV